MLDPAEAVYRRKHTRRPSKTLAKTKRKHFSPSNDPVEVCQQIWKQLCLSPNDMNQRANFMLLSLFREDIADNPNDPRWAAFVDALPGFRGFIENIEEY